MKLLKLNTKKFGIINPNNHYAINHKGLENSRGEKGNLYLKFNIDYPTDFKLSDENINSISELFQKIGIN
jgi:DnaJ-class molecular chaperone